MNGAAVVTVSPDKLKAVLSLRKARGGGTPLSPAAANDAIRASKVKGFNPDVVRKDLNAFFGGKTGELADYVLATGRAPKPGSEPKEEWRAMFLPAEEAEGSAPRRPPIPLRSGPGFPGRVPAFPGGSRCAGEKERRGPPDHALSRRRAGRGRVRRGHQPARAEAADVRLFEGLAMRRDVVVATTQGILEKGSDGMAILLRVRPHRDAEMLVTLAPDRMKASVVFPARRRRGADFRRRGARPTAAGRRAERH